jgi:alkanesulfonate monooxygenase SsuD/methylene tetrahydromethanopterin reductase-like flavin-dependent oxidoreductase (luciferase family)
LTFRPLGVLAKSLATLDVLSGGRTWCGLGAGWFEAEHTAYGIPFPPARERLDLLEETLQALPLLWGPGSPAFEGAHVHLPEALAYPRPLRGRLPLLVGGGGERRTLRLAARYADACNVTGDADTVRRKVRVLREPAHGGPGALRRRPRRAATGRVGVAIDDYGTGYSGLAYPARLPVTELKLDRSFVAAVTDDARGRAIVTSTVQLAHVLGLVLVAEGVEDEVTLESLRRIGCDFAQGYHLSRPLPAEAVLDWFERRVRSRPVAVPVPDRPPVPVQASAPVTSPLPRGAGAAPGTSR